MWLSGEASTQAHASLGRVGTGAKARLVVLRSRHPESTLGWHSLHWVGNQIPPVVPIPDAQPATQRAGFYGFTSS